jgi:hypothetical protein
MYLKFLLAFITIAFPAEMRFRRNGAHKTGKLWLQPAITARDA